MTGVQGKFGVFLIFLVFLTACGQVSALPPGFCLPDNNTVILGVSALSDSGSGGNNSSTMAEITAFSTASGRKSSIGMISDEWMNDRKFPLAEVTALRNEGIVPYILLMMRSSDAAYQKEPLFTLQNIASGKFDTELRSWAREARAFGTPVIIEYGTEVNQWQYPWNGYWNGNDKGPGYFQDAYRHIITIMKEEGASNLIWVYHVSGENLPDESWNTLSAYYPGDQYCDLVSVSITGAKNPFETVNGSFKARMEKALEDLPRTLVNKPVLVLTGTDVNNKSVNPVAWISEVFSFLYGDTGKNIAGLIWWNAGWPNDNNALHDTSMRIQDNPAVVTAFKTGARETQVKEGLYC
ncbi:MAG: hypothetical protein LUQ07_01530 [Methanospirillum sp.]|nr:hypothetical protein [Methanospirillum sp.]